MGNLCPRPLRPPSHAAGQQYLVDLHVREMASQGQSSSGWQVAEFPHVHVRGNEACKQCSPLPAWTACTALAHARARCIVHTMLLQGLAHHVDHVPEPKRNVPPDNARLIAQGILHEQLPALPAVCAWWRARIAHTFQHALLRRILMKEKIRDIASMQGSGQQPAHLSERNGTCEAVGSTPAHLSVKMRPPSSPVSQAVLSEGKSAIAHCCAGSSGPDPGMTVRACRGEQRGPGTPSNLRMPALK